jgi:hypothetical protein
VLRPCQHEKGAGGAQGKEHAKSQKLDSAMAAIGIDIGKNSFHIVGHDQRGAIVLRQKWSRGQVETRLANLPPCLIGMEAKSAFRHFASAATFGAASDRHGCERAALGAAASPRQEPRRGKKCFCRVCRYCGGPFMRLVTLVR